MVVSVSAKMTATDDNFNDDAFMSFSFLLWARVCRMQDDKSLGFPFFAAARSTQLPCFLKTDLVMKS